MPSNKIIDLDDDDDFGFTAISEDELPIVNKTADRVEAICKLIMPLLKNLMKDSDKEIIKWPNRKPKLEELIKKIEKIREN